MKKLLVIAGSINEYYAWLDQNKIDINTHTTLYIHREENLYGLRGNGFVFVGKYNYNPLYGSNVLKNAIHIGDLFEVRTHQAKAYIENQIPYNKPPLGIIPEKIWRDQRFNDLRDTIQRYAAGGYPVEIKWVREYNKLQNELNKIDKPQY